MKKTTSALTLALLLSACAGGGGMNLGGLGGSNGGGMSATNIGSNIVKTYVQNQCVSELQGRNEWRAIALAMSREKQSEWENKICGCATEEAPRQISAADMSQLLSDSGRAKVAADVTTRTVTACFKRLFHK
ncbi:MAG: hypothetical protein D8H97_11905 [Neisseria sp.]|nr:MAG: hypothetical protein D8H97_11905 [Neisseria sp.]